MKSKVHVPKMTLHLMLIIAYIFKDRHRTARGRLRQRRGKPFQRLLLFDGLTLALLKLRLYALLVVEYARDDQP